MKLKYLIIGFVFSSLFSNLESTTQVSTPYIIYRTPPGAGFWSNFFMILAGIDTADQNDWTPVVDMERYPNDYNEPCLWLNTMNSWEYFFDQPGGISLDTALQLQTLHNQGGKDGPFSRARVIIPPENKINRARELIEKYIKIKAYIIEEADTIIPQGLHMDMLGVHVRGTDRRKGAGQHLMTANPEVYLDKAKTIDQAYQFSKIYLACDEPETIDLFRAAFGDRLIVTEAHRVSFSNLTDSNPTMHKSWLFDASRPQHRYRLAKEVLIDALLLARTGHLLCGPSNVSHAAIYFAEEGQVIHEVESPGFFTPPSKTNI